MAHGTWWYSDEVPYPISSQRRRFNYTAADRSDFGAYIHGLDWQHPYAVNARGESFVWVVDAPGGAVESRSCSALIEAEALVKEWGRFDMRAALLRGSIRRAKVARGSYLTLRRRGRDSGAEGAVTGGGFALA